VIGRRPGGGEGGRQGDGVGQRYAMRRNKSANLVTTEFDIRTIALREGKP